MTRRILVALSFVVAAAVGAAGGWLAYVVAAVDRAENARGRGE